MMPMPGKRKADDGTGTDGDERKRTKIDGVNAEDLDLIQALVAGSVGSLVPREGSSAAALLGITRLPSQDIQLLLESQLEESTDDLDVVMESYEEDSDDDYDQNAVRTVHAPRNQEAGEPLDQEYIDNAASAICNEIIEKLAAELIRDAVQEASGDGHDGDTVADNIASMVREELDGRRPEATRHLQTVIRRILEQGNPDLVVDL